MIFQLNCSASRAIILIVFLTSAGCAHSPFAKGWEWSPTRPTSSAEQIRQEQNMEMARIRAAHPDWDKAVSDDIVVIECTTAQNETRCLGR